MTFGPPKSPRGETVNSSQSIPAMKAIKVFSLAQFTGNRLIKKSHDMIIMGLMIMIFCLLISAVILRNNDGSTTLRAVLSLLVTVMHDPLLTLGT